MKLLKSSILCCLGAIAISSCVKQNFTKPRDESGDDPHLTVNTTLRNLSDMAALNMNAGQYRVMGDTTIYGVVIADDHSGNFYKQIVIEDSSGGGITITLDKTTVYGDYPIGRKVYVKLKGLTLMNYKGLPEITFNVSAAGTTTGIPASLINNYIVKASFPNTVTPKDVNVTDLLGNPTSYYNTLVRIGVAGSDPVEFDSVSAGVPYAAPTSTGAISTALHIKDRDNGASLTMYNSSYATFQPAITPTGSGSVVVVFSNYNTPQLLIRDTSDVRFTEPRF